MAWQQWYFIIAWIIGIPSCIFMAGYKKDWKYISNLLFVLFTIYVLVSGGFFRGFF